MLGELEAYAAELVKTNPGTISRDFLSAWMPFLQERLEDCLQAYYWPRDGCFFVNKETKVNWRWFLTMIAEALELGDGSELTIISDKQKVHT